MTHQTPTAEEFLAQHEPDEDYEAAMADWKAHPGVLHVLPPDPMTRIAEALETIAQRAAGVRPINVYESASAEQTAVEIARLQALTSDRQGLHESVGKSVTAEQAALEMARLAKEQEKKQALLEEIADLEAKLHTAVQVISDVEAALGKSKAAPALAAKAVIEAWKNPKVPEDEGPEREDVLIVDSETGEHVEAPVGYVEEQTGIPGHTCTPHESGPDFCRECSGELQEWITWPCPAVSGEAQPLATGPEEGHEQPVQPAHNAPVEEWRAYARALGYAGPEIDKANRSVIRTTLGIAQPTAEAGA